MKTLRTICLVCAGYYLLQGQGFMFASVSTRMVHDLMPDGMGEQAFVQVQQDMSTVMASFAPYVLVGVFLCLLMAWRLKQWWRAIPLLSVLLFAGGLIWIFAFVRHILPFSKMIAQSMTEAPDAFTSYVDVVAGIGNWGSALPVLLPGVLIFIFWWRAQRAERRTASV